jgi:hypothetical protein
MKKICFFIFILLFQLVIYLSNAFAAEVTLAWDPSTGDPDGYRIHYGTVSPNYNQTIDVGNITGIHSIWIAARCNLLFCDQLL